MQGNDRARVDVNDVAILWPVPKSAQDVAGLLHANSPLRAGGTIWPAAKFQGIIDQAKEIKVQVGREATITVCPLKDVLTKPENWKVSAVRIDPSAPGTEPMLTDVFGSVPQVRLVLQPVTVETDGRVKVHDFSVHLVFNYVLRFDPPSGPGAPPRGHPDKVRFGEILKELAELKNELRSAGIRTDGELNVHPALASPQHATQVHDFLLGALSVDRLAAIAMVGVDDPEPWIFFATAVKNGGLELSTHNSLGGKSVQILNFRGGPVVAPQPTTTNVSSTEGVSTSLLPPRFGKAPYERLDEKVFSSGEPLQYRDIPDLIANPFRAHFFNTDCVSCHTESTRRHLLSLGSSASVSFPRPPSVSGVASSVLPKNLWNVRNFGWSHLEGATVTQRTANEAAESAHYINQKYFQNP